FKAKATAQSFPLLMQTWFCILKEDMVPNFEAFFQPFQKFQCCPHSSSGYLIACRHCTCESVSYAYCVRKSMEYGVTKRVIRCMYLRNLTVRSTVRPLTRTKS